MARLMAAREASHCMTNSQLSPAQQQAGRRLQKAIGKELARLYASIAAEPAPDELLQLLASVDRKTMPAPQQTSPPAPEPPSHPPRTPRSRLSLFS